MKLSRSLRCVGGIPVIDLGPFVTGGNLLSKKQTALHLHKACSEIGFFAITGHGVPASLQSAVVKTVVEFFAQTVEEKSQISLTSSTSLRGWQKIGMNQTKGQQDDQEAIDFISSVPSEVVNSGPFAAPNL